jgi:hypothetical protein
MPSTAHIIPSSYPEKISDTAISSKLTSPNEAVNTNSNSLQAQIVSFINLDRHWVVEISSFAYKLKHSRPVSCEL